MTKRTQAQIAAIDDKALAFIRSTTAERGYPPSIRELSAHLGMKSTQGGHAALVRLQDAGRIRREPNSPRSITVLEAAP